MGVTDLKPGDLVMYGDPNHALWGPWRVVDISGNVATVEVERLVNYSLDVRCLQKVKNDRKAL